MEHDKILKYLQEIASPHEILEMEEWITSSIENTHKFNILKARYIATTFEETSKIVNVEKSLKQHKKAINQNSTAREKRIWVEALRYAATITLVLGLISIFRVNTSVNGPVVSIPDDAITLKLENGNVQIVEDNGTMRVMDTKGKIVGTQRGSRLIYKNGAPTEKLAYNTLTVPYGKRFDIILSDSTHILLNAGTTLKYPVKFMEGHKREVFLSGEAFFEVAEDAAHPFIVNANGLNIKVLGTTFNVSAYPEDNTTNTVLVEGSVALYQDTGYDSAKKTFLAPGYLASMDKTNMKISIEKTETFLYTAWRNGNIVFRHAAFNDIVKKLERHYDVIIKNNDHILGGELFTASFENPSLEQVLNTFRDNYGIEYSIDNDNITINP